MPPSSLSDGEVLYLFLNQKRHIDEDKNRSETTKREYARDLSYEEVKALLVYYQHHPINYPLLSVLATTGFRVQEIANAKWQDIYYDTYQGRYYLKVIGKRGKERHAILFYNVFERICQFRNQRRLPVEINPLDDSPLFTTNSNRPYDFHYLSRYITSIIERTELPFLKYKQSRITPHFFRHFFAMYSLKQGVNVAYIQQTLGHADIRTTQIYLDKTLKKDNDAAASWDEKRF